MRSVVERLEREGKLRSALGDSRGREVRAWELNDWTPTEEALELKRSAG